MGQLTTHVLDTANGTPAAGMEVALFRLDGRRVLSMKTVTLDADGRAGSPLLAGEELVAGRYRLVFSVAAYFSARGTVQAATPFLSEVPIDFGIDSADAHYHVPLLVSPWAYSTYRGS